jgi:hypothetical protein
MIQKKRKPQLWQWRRRPLYHSPQTGGMSVDTISKRLEQYSPPNAPDTMEKH